MAPSPMVGVRIPTEMLTQIDAIASSKKSSRSEVILSLLERGLSPEVSTDAQAILARLEAIEIAIQLLSKQVIT